MAADAEVAPTARWRWALAGAVLAGVAVAGALAAYAEAHPGDEAPLFTLWFGSMVRAKTVLATAAASLLVVQIASAVAMYRGGPGWVSWVHRWSGVAAFGLTLPVAFACVWSLGFEDDSPRVLAHSVAGCAFFGVFTVKMLALRVRRLPGWVLPVLGGLVVTLLGLVWSTSGRCSRDCVRKCLAASPGTCHDRLRSRTVTSAPDTSSAPPKGGKAMTVVVSACLPRRR